jgi:hypothetical protein
VPSETQTKAERSNEFINVLRVALTTPSTASPSLLSLRRFGGIEYSAQLLFADDFNSHGFRI